MSERLMPENFGHGMWVDQTTIHPLGLLLVLVCGFALQIIPRRHAIWPMVIMACFVAPAQRVVIFTLDFNMLRLMVLFGFMRLFIRKELDLSFQVQPLDRVLIALAIAKTLIHTTLTGSASTLVFELGSSFDTIGMYFMFRCLIRTWKDVEQAVMAFVFISLPVAAFFLNELLTERNFFSTFGGVPEYTKMRQGRLRCQGAFPHPIIAGCFWASLMPLFVASWWGNVAKRKWIWSGLVSASLIVIATASSTPVFAVLVGILGGAMFIFRDQMRQIRWWVFFVLVGLHMVMNAPVWHLISRVSAVGGSTAYFRYAIIDGAVNHVREWWLLGTHSTAHWFWGAQDVTNQFVLMAVRGGMLTLILFVISIALAFRSVGRIWRREAHNQAHLAMAWALGVALFVHCANFIGVSYFGQITMVWYLLLAMITSMDVATERATESDRGKDWMPVYGRINGV
ncbi:MAG: hypothetical protein ABFS56_05850 [Pseudomonadota bacterium]